MKGEHLFEAIGLVEDRLVEEAADAGRTATPWKKWLATAACLVAVVGIGSLTVGTMFRGCGAKSQAPETNQSSAVAADSAAPESTESQDSDAPAESPEAPMTGETASGADGSNETGGCGGIFNHYADPILPMTADAAAELSVRRDVKLEVEEDAAHAGVRDAYTVSNAAGRDQTVTFYYPIAASLDVLEETELQILQNGGTKDYVLYGGASLTGYSDDGLNLGGRSGWQELETYLEGEDYLQAALETPQLEQPVTVWRFTDVRYNPDTAQSGASLAVWFEMPENTRVLTYGINGMGTDGSRTAYDYFVASPRQAERHDLIFLGDVPASYTVQGYVNGGLEEKQDDITGSIEILTMTLGEYLHGITESELEYQTAADLLTRTVLSENGLRRYEPAMLEEILQGNRAVQRVFYAAFNATVPAGGTVELTASYRKEASYNFYAGPESETDLYGFDLLTTLGSSLSFTEQTASLTLPDRNVIVSANSFGFTDGGAVSLDVSEPYYYLELRRQ